MKRHPAFWLTVTLAVFYVLAGNSRITSGDGETMFQVTRALGRGRADLPPSILPPVDTVLADSTDTQIPYTLPGRDGRTYSKYGLGQSLAALPLYLVGLAWRAGTGIGHAPRTAALLLNSLLTAGTAGLLLVMARELGCSTRTGVMLALAYGLCSPAWVYTHTFFSEPLVAFLLTGAALALVRFDHRETVRWLALAGGALGFALLTRISAAAALPAFGVYVTMHWRAKRLPLQSMVPQATAAAMAFGIGAGLMIVYNLIRFGNPFDFGYHTSNWQTPLLSGLYGLTLSPGKGILWYAPVVVLGLAGFLPFARRRLPEALLCAGVSAGYLLLHSVYTYWEGGWSWGPRLIFPALPFILLPATSILGRRHQSRVAEFGLALLLVLGFLIQIPAIGSNYAHTLQQAFVASPDDFQERVLYQPRHSPLIGQWASLLQVIGNLRDPGARAQLADLLAQAQPGDALLLADSPTDALRLQRQTILAFNLPDLWLVSAPWLRQEAVP
jgi:hypothetical protein